MVQLPPLIVLDRARAAQGLPTGGSHSSLDVIHVHKSESDNQGRRNHRGKQSSQHRPKQPHEAKNHATGAPDGSKQSRQRLAQIHAFDPERSLAKVPTEIADEIRRLRTDDVARKQLRQRIKRHDDLSKVRENTERASQWTRDHRLAEIEAWRRREHERLERAKKVREAKEGELEARKQAWNLYRETRRLMREEKKRKQAESPSKQKALRKLAILIAFWSRISKASQVLARVRALSRVSNPGENDATSNESKNVTAEEEDQAAIVIQRYVRKKLIGKKEQRRERAAEMLADVLHDYAEGRSLGDIYGAERAFRRVYGAFLARNREIRAKADLWARQLRQWERNNLGRLRSKPSTPAARRHAAEYKVLLKIFEHQSHYAQWREEMRAYNAKQRRAEALNEARRAVGIHGAQNESQRMEPPNGGVPPLMPKLLDAEELADLHRAAKRRSEQYQASPAVAERC